MPKRYSATLGAQEIWEAAAGRVPERTGPPRAARRAADRESALAFRMLRPRTRRTGKGLQVEGIGWERAGEQGKRAWSR